MPHSMLDVDCLAVQLGAPDDKATGFVVLFPVIVSVFPLICHLAAGSFSRTTDLCLMLGTEQFTLPISVCISF